MVSVSRFVGIALGALSFTSLPATAAGTTLVFWNNQQASDVAAAICKSFTKKTGISVDVNWIGQPDYKASLLRHAGDGDLPDVAMVAGDFLSMNRELKFSEIPAGLQAKGVLKNAQQAGLYEGKILGAPITWGNHLMLFYNRDFIKKPAKTFAEMEKQAVELRARNVKTLGMNFGEMYWLTPFMGAFGGWPVDDKGNITLNTANNAQALDFYFSLASKGITQKECRNDCQMERFTSGEFAYSIGGDWVYRDLEEKMGAKLGVTTIPLIDNRVPTPMFSSYLLVFPNNSLNGPKKEALIKFLKYMQSPEVQQRWANEADLFPVDEKIFKRVTAKAGENTKGSLAQLRVAKAMPNDRSMAFAWEGMAKGFSAMYNGRVTAEQAVKLMQTHAEKVAKRAGD